MKRQLALLALQTEIVYIITIDPLHTEPWPPPGHEALLKKLSAAAGLLGPEALSLKETYIQCMDALLAEIENGDT